MYRMTIQPGCVVCGRCSFILPGWPEQHQRDGLSISARHLEEHGEQVGRVVASCPLELIEINEVVPKNTGVSHVL